MLKYILFHKSKQLITIEEYPISLLNPHITLVIIGKTLGRGNRHLVAAGGRSGGIGPG